MALCDQQCKSGCTKQMSGMMFLLAGKQCCSLLHNAWLTLKLVNFLRVGSSQGSQKGRLCIFWCLQWHRGQSFLRGGDLWHPHNWQQRGQGRSLTDTHLSYWRISGAHHLLQEWQAKQVIPFLWLHILEIIYGPVTQSSETSWSKILNISCAISSPWLM